MIAIQLSQGLRALVDDVDADLADRNWWACKCGERHHYAQGASARRVPSGRTGKEYLHRVIAARMTGDLAGLDVDHINGDTLDNRRANLRAVSHQANIRNRRGANKQSASGVRGVRADRDRWTAYIMLPGKRYKHLGTFDTQAEAVAARKAGEQAHWS